MFFHALTFARSRGPVRKLFEHEAHRPSAQTSPEGPGKCLCNEKKHVLSIFLHILLYSNQICTENAVKTLKNLFSYIGFSKQNGIGCKLSNVITSSQ